MKCEDYYEKLHVSFLLILDISYGRLIAGSWEMVHIGLGWTEHTSNTSNYYSISSN